jgi:hypothetical protein
MAASICETPKFKRKQKVVTVGALPGVPIGTVGKVYYEAGVRWFRYHVAFENGVELGNVDGGALVTVEEWEQQQADERRAQLLAEREARTGQVQVSAGPRGH